MTTDTKADHWRTEFGVQPFVRDRRALKAEQIRPMRGRDQALRLAERLKDTKAGVVAFSLRCAPALDEYEEPVVLAAHGQVPEELLERLAA